ncbi:phosphoglycerate mutase-like protein [Armillaria solidipes]|uniref:Phosphoglycerate mutase-like protein n=1 Tax=Armillaria solidipes TaxID=1076256 RepID=A0A2H3CKI2_9AGAR|nr:phosphoglycerate mutase-like protein [Armillaria solidipes]
MVEKIYIVRHGFRMNWVMTNWKSATGLPRDPPLAALGEVQAQECASYFLSLPEDERPTAIFSSPYYRCLQTASPVSTALGIPIFVEHGLSEWYSPVEPNTGLHPRPGPASSLEPYFPGQISSDWDSIHYPSRLGETVDEVLVRVETFLQDFLPLRPKGERLLIVSHAATIAALVRLLSGERDMPIRIGCCSLSQFHQNGNTWTRVKTADGSHLSGGSLRDWGFQDIEVDNGRVVNDPGVPGSENEKNEPVGSVVSKNLNVNVTSSL